MSTKPYFSKKLLCTAPDGTYANFAGSKKVSAFADRIEIGGTAIPSSTIIDVVVNGNVLHVVHADPSGKRVENYFRHDTFLPSKAKRELAAFLETARSHMPQLTTSPALTADGSATRAPSVPPTERARRLPPRKSRESVTVFSAKVAFPPCCPTCMGPVSRVARLAVGSGFNDTGTWLVPTCEQHRGMGRSIAVHGWKSSSGESTFSFAEAPYADRFYRMNAAPSPNPFHAEAESSQLRQDIRNGTRFVVHEYVLSAIRFTVKKQSNVSRVQGRGEAVLKGLPHTMTTLLAGWWSIPGLVFTPIAIYRNLRGGIDVTARVEQVVLGVPFPARGA